MAKSTSPTIPFLLTQLSKAAVERNTVIAAEIAQLEAERASLVPFLDGNAAASLSGKGVNVTPRRGVPANNTVPDKIVTLLRQTQGWMKFADIAQRVGFSSIVQGRYYMKRLRSEGKIKMRGRTAATEYSIV